MSNLNVIVAYRGDRLDEEAHQATVSDKPDDLSRLNQRINQGNGIFQAWVESKGGRVIAVMGDGGRLEVGADHLHELTQIKDQYAQEVGTTASVGVGKMLSEAEKALEYAVLTGGGSIQLYTDELLQELGMLQDPDNEVKLFSSYLDKAEPAGKEPALNKPGSGGGMTGPSMASPSGPEAPAGEASEHSENESLNNMLENQPDIGGQFTQLAEASEGQEQQQKEQQAQQQQEGEQADNLRGAIVDVLKQFKEQGPLWEQLKEAQPDAYKTLTGVMAAMVAMAKQMYSGDDQQEEEQPVKKSMGTDSGPSGDMAMSEIFDKSTLPMAAPAPVAPAMHNTVEGFLGQLKSLPKDGPHRGKLITSHMNHAPFLAALQTHPQGKQVHAMLTGFLNSKANAGVGVGAKVMAKALPKGAKLDVNNPGDQTKNIKASNHPHPNQMGGPELPTGVPEPDRDAFARSPIFNKKMNKAALDPGKTGRHQVVLPVGSQKDAAASASRDVGKLKVADPATGLTKWRSVRAGLVMSPDGTPTSSRNPSGGKGQ